MYMRVLQEFVALLERGKAIRRDEVVIDAVLLAGPRWSRRIGHRQANAGFALEQRARQAGLTAARRRGDHEKIAFRNAHARQAHATPHSMFCTCSRICSISTLISSAA